MQARFGSDKVRWAFAQLGVDVDAEFLNFDPMLETEMGTPLGESEDGDGACDKTEYDPDQVTNGLLDEDDDGEAYPWEAWMLEIDYHSVLWDEHPLHVIFEDEAW